MHVSARIRQEVGHRRSLGGVGDVHHGGGSSLVCGDVARSSVCPCGWATRAIYDRSLRPWRHLDLAGAKLWLEAEICRLHGRACGRVHTEVVPWAVPELATAGMMGVLADAAIGGGGEVIVVWPDTSIPMGSLHPLRPGVATSRRRLIRKAASDRVARGA